ncbi:uncharacterized protein OCT59_024818 [Rhizophagus irregularis]|uniref:uncharacterized protein n=1 Tax=Rhizophagus irregularis TaxID=588596 RepID=UPI0033267C3B|nr:hypothetical protein OCT59_024818 [Rhizophagus irregularis]
MQLKINAYNVINSLYNACAPPVLGIKSMCRIPKICCVNHENSKYNTYSSLINVLNTKAEWDNMIMEVNLSATRRKPESEIIRERSSG